MERFSSPELSEPLKLDVMEVRERLMLLIISCGGYSTSGHVAIGDVVRGAVEVSESAPAAEVRELIMKELPETPGFIADMFSGMAEMMSH